MTTAITNTKSYSLASISSSTTPLAIAYISIDLHTSRDADADALDHLLPELLLSGCGSLTREAFLDKLTTLGASITTTIDRGVLQISVTATAETFPKVLPLLKLLLIAPQFAPSEIKRVKQLAKNLLVEHEENSKVRAHESLYNAHFDATDRRYSHSFLELEGAIASTTKRKVETYYKRAQLSYWQVAIASTPKNVSTFTNLVKRIHPSSEVVHRTHSPKLKVTKRLYTTDIPSRQNIDFSIGASIPITINHPDYPALTMALAILGKWGGFTGRLMSTVREKDGLTYGIYAGAEGFHQQETGLWRIMTFFSPQNAVTGLTATFREVKKLYAHGTSQEELDSFKVILDTMNTLTRDSLTGQLKELHAYQRQGFNLDEIATLKQKVLMVSVADVNEAILKYLNPASLVVCAAGPTTAVESDMQAFIKSV